MPEGFDALPSGGSDFAGLDISSIFGDSSSSPTDNSTGGGGLKSSLGKASKGLGGVGDVIGGVGEIFQGMSAKKGFDAQAGRFRQEAVLDLYNGGQEVKATQDKGVATIGALSATAGASGVTQGGSVVNARAATITNVNTADMASRFAAGVHSANDLYESDVLRWQGKQAETAGFVNGGFDIGKGVLTTAMAFA